MGDHSQRSKQIEVRLKKQKWDSPIGLSPDIENPLKSSFTKPHFSQGTVGGTAAVGNERP